MFGPKEFRKIHWLDFRAQPRLTALFEESLDPAAIAGNIELELGTGIDLSRDLLFFDEIGESQAAVDSLKYFAERLPNAFVCASGSNIGLLRSFPVGKVEGLTLFPFTFEEFLMGSGRAGLLEAYRSAPNPADPGRGRTRRTATVHRHCGRCCSTITSSAACRKPWRRGGPRTSACSNARWLSARSTAD